MNQQSFNFEEPPRRPPPEAVVGATVRHSDPDTSHMAADSFTRKRLSQTQADVYRFICQKGSATDEEIYEGLRHKYRAESTARKRRTDLVQLGYVEDSGRRAVNRNLQTVIIWQPCA
jgi:hypothetical protein